MNYKPPEHQPSHNTKKELDPQMRTWEHPLTKGQWELLERQQQRKESDKNFLRKLESQSKIENKTPEQIAHEKKIDEQYAKEHEDYMAQIAEKFSSFHNRSFEDFKNFQDEVREELKSRSKSHEEKPDLWNNGVVIPQPDSSVSKKDSGLFGQGDDQSKQRNKGPKVDDDFTVVDEQPPYKDNFNVVYNQPKSQGPEALNRQLNGQEMQNHRLNGQKREKLTDVLRRTVQAFNTTDIKNLPKEFEELLEHVNGKPLSIDHYDTAVKKLEGKLREKEVERMIASMQEVNQKLFRRMDKKQEKVDEGQPNHLDNKGQKADKRRPFGDVSNTFNGVVDREQQEMLSVNKMLENAYKEPENKENRGKT